MTRIFLLCLLAFILSSCSPIRDPIPLIGDKAVFIGTWQSKLSFPSENKTDNTVIVLNEDSSSLYMQCINYDSPNGSSGHSSTGARGAFVTSIESDELVLSIAEPNLHMSVNYKVKIGGRPYKRKGQWFMMVEGTELRKLGPDEASDFESWHCSDDSENK